MFPKQKVMQPNTNSPAVNPAFMKVITAVFIRIVSERC